MKIDSRWILAGIFIALVWLAIVQLGRLRQAAELINVLTQIRDQQEHARTEQKLLADAFSKKVIDGFASACS